MCVCYLFKMYKNWIILYRMFCSLSSSLNHHVSRSLSVSAPKANVPGTFYCCIVFMVIFNQSHVNYFRTFTLCPNHLTDIVKHKTCCTFASIPKGYVVFPTIELLGQRNVFFLSSLLKSVFYIRVTLGYNI